ncbi:MAG: hypothetical protein QM739_16555 [Propionivibrio sp.]
MQNSFSRDMFVGFIVLFSYLAIGASPERSLIEWGTFYLAITGVFFLVGIIGYRITEYIVFLPLVLWHVFWAVFQVFLGKFSGLALTHLLACVVSVSILNIAFRLLKERSHK